MKTTEGNQLAGEQNKYNQEKFIMMMTSIQKFVVVQ